MTESPGNWPADLEVGSYHWFRRPSGSVFVVMWNEGYEANPRNPDDSYRRWPWNEYDSCTYVGPCLTPDEVRAEAERAQPKWQPIETAPKDDFKVVLLVHENRTIAGYFDSTRECWKELESWRLEEEPTNWMPLPQPPKESV